MSLNGVYAITDEILTPKHTILVQVKAALEGGISLLQYRNKTDTDDDIETLCIDLNRLCKLYNVPFFIDDRPYLAEKIGADGLHIGKDDMTLDEARKIFTKGFIGVSCYGSIKKALEAQSQGADYVAFGSFFHSPTKPKSGVVSMNVLAKAKKALSIPICAIGGINIDNIDEISAHKPDMISIVSAVWDGDIQQNIKLLKKGSNQ